MWYMIAFLSITVFISVCVATVAGFGAGTILTPILLLFFDQTQSLIFVGIIHWFADLFKIMLFFKHRSWTLLILFGLPAVICSFFAALLAITISKAIFARLFGSVLLLYVAGNIFLPTFRLAPTNMTAICGGALSGFLGGLVGTQGAVRTLFLSFFNLPKNTYLWLSGAIPLLIDTTRLLTYITWGVALDRTLIIALLFALPVAGIASITGKLLVQKISQEKFRKTVDLFLLLMGLYLIIHG